MEVAPGIPPAQRRVESETPRFHPLLREVRGRLAAGDGTLHLEVLRARLSRCAIPALTDRRAGPMPPRATDIPPPVTMRARFTAAMNGAPATAPTIDAAG
ncbi:hypothetical protein DFJ69_5515 [Thermomonospora umbrina]|uniref:Uncharacterized protein n=1 Tax=Thermomonospora umbrina TaxID=111806 RepID=A0A3D9T5L0_9ACTN|nr:hypothetical protein DFJ69_5515 [Thermomonospora umbrina]